MPDFGLNFDAKKFFFDKKAVLDQFGRDSKKTLAALSRVGAFLRRRAKSSMRSGGKKSKTSEPGQPPRVHQGDLKNRLYFVFDSGSRSLVVGPEKYGSASAGLMEFGGAGPVVSHGKTSTRTFAPHPFMGPALDAEIAAGTIPAQWAASVSN